MKKQILFVGIALLVMFAPQRVFGQQGPIDDLGSEVTPLSNRDILLMVGKRVSQENIVGVINTSPCVFDTFPPVLDDLKRRGVPEPVLKAMVRAPYGPSAKTQHEELDEQAIYHYAEQLRQRNVLNPSPAGRGAAARFSQADRTRTARATRRRT